MNKTPLKEIISVGIIGNVLELYDYTLFGFFTPLLSKLFFPDSDPAGALIATLGIFAAGFVMRPIGSLLFGYLGDRLGRKRALFLSVACISLPTIGIGLLPDYAAIGIWAPLLLTLCRLLQGLSVGGEYTSSILYLVEHSPENRKGFTGSFALVGAGIGMLLGSAAAALSALFFQESAWCWRVPFLLGIVTTGYALILRSRSSETSEFLEMQKEGALSENPLKEAVLSQKKSIVTLAGFNLLPAIAGYMLYIYMPTFLHGQAGLPLSSALWITACFLLLFNLLAPLVGLLSDLYGKKRLFLAGSLGFVLFSLPLFQLLASGSLPSVFAGLFFFTLLIACYHAPLPAAMAEFFPARTRSSSVAISYNVAASLFSGSCPLVASLLIDWSGNPLSPAYYLTAAALISFFAVLKGMQKEPDLRLFQKPQTLGG